MVVAVAGAHTREIWSRLPLEIAVAIEDRCRGWGPLDGSAIMEASLCDNSKLVAFITKKFQIENYMPIMLYFDDLS